MARGRIVSPLRARSRRATDWQLQFTSTASVAIAANSKVLVASITGTVLADISPATVIRTRGILQWRSDQAGGTEEQLGAMGLCFVNDLALAAGAASIPGPVAEATFDGWFVHQFLASATGGALPATATEVWTKAVEIDSKAMRKFDGDLGLALMVENSHGSNAFNVAIFLRILVKAG